MNKSIAKSIDTFIIMWIVYFVILALVSMMLFVSPPPPQFFVLNLILSAMGAGLYARLIGR